MTVPLSCRCRPVSTCFCGPEEAKRFFSRTPNAAGKKAESWKATKKQPRTRISCKPGNGSGALSDRPDRKRTARVTLCKERTFIVSPNDCTISLWVVPCQGKFPSNQGG